MASSTTPPRRKGTFLPPRGEGDFAALLELSRFLDRHTDPAVLLGPDGKSIPLPAEVYETLVEIVGVMKRHRAVMVAPVDQKLSTQEAADYLGISRPTLIKLLTEGKLAYETIEGSRHRRVTLGDLIEYRDRRADERREALREMVSDAEQDRLYDIPPEEYSAAVKAARKEIAKERSAK